MVGPNMPLTLAIPNLHSYHPHTGIGRVLASLQSHWGKRVHLIGASFKTPDLPILRNLPHGVRIPTGTDFVLLPKLTGAEALQDTEDAPSIVIVHDIGIIDFPGDRQGMGWLSYQCVLRSLRGLRHVTQIIAVSQFTKERLLHHLPELNERVSVIGNGVGDAFLNYRGNRSEARRRLQLKLQKPLGRPLLIYVGSEIPRKNVRLLLEVLKRLKRYYPEAQLLKIGAAGHPRWRQQTLNTLSCLSLQLDKDVVLWENVDDYTLAGAYRAADAFVSASLYEGFCLPVLEAMAVGTPAVTTNRGALPEVVEDASRVAEPEVEPLVKAIRQVLERGTLDTSTARARAAENNWARAAEAYLQLMHHLNDAKSPMGDN